MGHLFCRHLYYKYNKRRKLSVKEKEFEAENVAWLVCKRIGIDNPSEQYLASYSQDGKIPLCSVEMIMKAVTEIEKMISSEVRIMDSLWYKESKSLKDQISEAKAKLR